MELDVRVFLAAVCLDRHEGRLAHIAVLPCDRVDIRSCEVRDLDVSAEDVPLFIDHSVVKVRHIGHGSESRLPLLVLVAELPPAGIFQDKLYEVIGRIRNAVLYLPGRFAGCADRELHALIQQEVRHIFADQLCRTKAVTPAAGVSGASVDAVCVELRDVGSVPGIPQERRQADPLYFKGGV